jgi:hypothetical protein
MKTILTHYKECTGDCGVGMKLFILTMGLMVVYGISAAIVLGFYETYKFFM